MNKGIIAELQKTTSISIIEKHLIYSFLKTKGILYGKSPIISSFLKCFSPQSQLLKKIAALNINNLKLLENCLELLIPNEDRKFNGAFFTPTYIVNFIIKELKPSFSSKCLDPSCGCGAFLIGLVDYYSYRYKKSIKQTIQENIYGSDVLDYNIRRTQLILSIAGLLNDEIIEASDFNLYHQDSLKSNWSDKFDIIVGNPPYVKYQDLTDENRKFLIENWSTINNGTFNLYFAFFELGYQLLNTEGKLGYITPNNYFTSLAGLSLRQYFTHKKCLERVIDFRHKKVFDAQTYTAITFLNKKKNETILFDKVPENENCEAFLKKANGSPNKLIDLNVKKWRLLKKEEQKNIKIIESIGTPINKLFNIAAGIATLKDEVFFVDGTNEKDGLLTKETENGIFYIEKEITKPVFKISNFKAQSEIESNTLRIITPYSINGKNSTPIPEDEFQAKYPNCYAYLCSEKQKLASRDKGKKNYSPFYVWGRTQGIARLGKKLLTPTFSKHPRFLFAPESNSYFTNGYGIYLNKLKKQDIPLFETIGNPLSKEENILVVQKILNSIIMDYYVTTTSVSIQGGFPCYQKNFIEKFTIPNFSEQEINYLNQLNDKDEIDAFLVEKYQVNIPSPNLCS